MSSIKVQERGRAKVPPELAKRLRASEEFWHLIENKFLSAKLLGSDELQLEGSCYVGRTSVAGITLYLNEKNPGTLKILSEFALLDQYRPIDIEAPISTLTGASDLLINEFIRSVRAYVSAGRNNIYIQKQRTGSIAGGCLDITRTLSLRARGQRHKLGYSSPDLTYSVDINRIIALALKKIEKLTKSENISSQIKASSRGMALVFSDVVVLDDRFTIQGLTSKFNLKRLAESLNHEHQQLLELAVRVLQDRDIDLFTESLERSGRSWFLNLEKIFECAVRGLLGEILSDVVTVKKGGTLGRRVFEEKTDKYKVDPDMVFVSRSEVVGVGDVKYKLWEAAGDTKDLYELICHTSTVQSKKCFLVYPADQFSTIELGQTVDGISVWLFGVNILNLKQDLKQLCIKFGLLS